MDIHSFRVFSSLKEIYPAAKVYEWDGCFFLQDGKFTHTISNTSLFYRQATKFESIVNPFRYLTLPEIVNLCETENYEMALTTCHSHLAVIHINHFKIPNPYDLLRSSTPEQLNERIVQSFVMGM